MTVSMLTTRLSSVITGCGWKETTCSRRSMISRSRSTTPARACGTILIVRDKVIKTKAATTNTTIRATIENPLFEYERGRALDLRNFDTCAGVERLPLEVRAGRPFLAADPYSPAVCVHALEHDRLGADEGGGPGPCQRRHVDVTPCDRPQECERGDRDPDEDDQLQKDAAADAGGHRCADGRKCHRPEEEETGRQELADGEENRRDQPEGETSHGAECVTLTSVQAECGRQGAAIGQILGDVRVTVLAVEQEAAHADRVGAFDVVLDRVADHHCGGRLDLEALERSLEDGRVRLRLAVGA